MCNKTKDKTKITFADIVYNVLVVKGFWWNIKRFDCMFLSCHVRVSEWIHTL